MSRLPLLTPQADGGSLVPADGGEAFLKDEIRDGHLTLIMDEGGAEQQAWGRLQQSDVRVRLRYHPVWGPLISNVILVLILFIGSFTSLFLKLTLPNSRQRLELKEKLDRLGAQVNDLSNNTGQRLIFFLRIQLERTADLLNPKAPGGGRYTFSPDYADRANRCDLLTTRASRHLELLTRLDRSVRAMYGLQYRRLLPPSQFGAVDERIGKISDITVRVDVTDQDLDRIEALVKEVEDLVQKMDQRNSADFLPGVRDRLNEVKSFLKPLLEQPAGPNTVDEVVLAAAAKKIRDDCQGPFACLNGGPDLTAKLSYQAAADLDNDVKKLEIIVRYVRLRPNLALTAPLENSVEWIYTSQLRDKLRTNGWDAIKAMTRLVKEGEKGIVAQHLRNALTAAPPRASIRPTRRDVTAGDYFEFAVQFDDDDLKSAVAREDFKCNWEIDLVPCLVPPPADSSKWRKLKYAARKRIWRETLWHNGQPYKHEMQNWKVPFTTTVPGKYSVTCAVELNSAEVAKLSLEPDFDIQKRPFTRTGPRLRLELISMAVALAPALLALLTTAQTKIAEAEWYTGVAAVFALGFTVDQLKNLITQRSS
jgi:hypothetical protein